MADTSKYDFMISGAAMLGFSFAYGAKSGAFAEAGQKIAAAWDSIKATCVEKWAAITAWWSENVTPKWEAVKNKFACYGWWNMDIAYYDENKNIVTATSGWLLFSDIDGNVINNDNGIIKSRNDGEFAKSNYTKTAPTNKNIRYMKFRYFPDSISSIYWITFGKATFTASRQNMAGYGIECYESDTLKYRIQIYDPLYTTGTCRFAFKQGTNNTIHWEVGENTLIAENGVAIELKSDGLYCLGKRLAFDSEV